MVPRIYIINLEKRRDRRKEILGELARIGRSEHDDRVSLFPAIAPDTAAPFSSIGERGCFLSHLGVLKAARDEEADVLLTLEDDAFFTHTFIEDHETMLDELARLDWGMAYLGYLIAPEDVPADTCPGTRHWKRLPPSVGVQTAHAVLFRRQVLSPLIAYLESMLARPGGSPEGGPMHVDGAYGWFRAAHPEFETLIAATPCILQRSSRSDISADPAKERLPFLSLLRRARNAIRPR